MVFFPTSAETVGVVFCNVGIAKWGVLQKNKGKSVKNAPFREKRSEKVWTIKKKGVNLQ